MMDLSELFAVIYLLWDSTHLELEYALAMTALLRFTRKDKTDLPPPALLLHPQPRSDSLFLWASDGWLALFLSL